MSRRKPSVEPQATPATEHRPVEPTRVAQRADVAPKGRFDDAGSGDHVETVIRYLAGHLGAASAVAAYRDPDAGVPRIHASWGLPLGDEVLNGLEEDGWIVRSLAQRAPIARRIAASGNRGNGDRATVTDVFVAPALTAAQVDCILCVGFDAPPTDRDRVLGAVASFASIVGLLLEDQPAIAELLSAASRDGLTGCATYATLVTELEHEVMRCERSGYPLSVCFIDLDGFKAINDRHGHLRGNEILVAVGECLRRRVRAIDMVARFGGDEFVVILPDTGTLGASFLAESLVRDVRAAGTEAVGEPIDITVGIAEWTPGSSALELLELANIALRDRRAFRAKRR